MNTTFQSEFKMKNKVPFRVEHIVRKGEIACNKRFLLFPQCCPHLYIYL